MRYLSSNDVAEILGINISTLKRWTENGTIGCSKTAGGHRKFTMQHVRDYYRKNKNADKNLGLGLERLEHKTVYDLINKGDYSELAKILADSSLASNEITVNNIINGSYMKGISASVICDEIIEPGSMIVENALRQKYISHVEAFISRKLITRSVESLNQNKPNGSFNGKTALCINFEDNLPDLGVVMSEIILRHNGYNVLNTGSHAELGNLQDVIKKKGIALLLFYLCDMQCCMATVRDNLSKTSSQVKEIVSLANKLKVNIVFGGSGIQFLPDVSNQISSSFNKYSDLEKII